MAARLLFCGGSPAGSWTARRRSRWMSSATLASSAKWVNARMTGNGLVDVDAVEQRGQLGAVDLRAAYPEGLDAGAFDEIEDLVAVLLAHGLAEDRAEQTNVLAHRFGGFSAHLGALHRADRFEGGVGRIRG